MKASGAGDGNRTRVACLEGRCSAIELHRRFSLSLAALQRIPFFVWFRAIPCAVFVGLPVFPDQFLFRLPFKEGVFFAVITAGRISVRASFAWIFSL